MVLVSLKQFCILCLFAKFQPIWRRSIFCSSSPSSSKTRFSHFQHFRLFFFNETLGIYFFNQMSIGNQKKLITFSLLVQFLATFFLKAFGTQWETQPNISFGCLQLYKRNFVARSVLSKKDRFSRKKVFSCLFFFK